MVVLLQEWLYLSTNLCSSEDDLNKISLKVSSFTRPVRVQRSLERNLNIGQATLD